MSISGPSSANDSETFGQDASFHLEQPIGAMTISPSGRDVALASREGLHIIDLDSPYSLPRYLPHRTPWEVADVQWSPFASRDYWVVSTSNQKALVWNLAAKSWQDTIEFVLHGHTRAITDINFSAHNPDILATCAVDSFVHCWDLKSPPLRPAFSFSDWFAGATQVKWSRQDEHVVASSHDKFLHIWDNRNGAIPVRTIQAHDTKIYGVDWNRFHTNKIVTCSLDRTIKFWDTNNPKDEPERVIETPFPVWRARHTPFGWGMMAMPQRGSSDLFLYDRRGLNGPAESGHVRPVARFSGHVGQVKEFLWRARGTPVNDVDQRDFQLISWGTDKELRLHRLDPDALEGIGYEKGVSKIHRLNFTRKGARYRTFRDLPEETNSPIEPPSRGESFLSHGQLHFRKRASTNVGMSKVPASQIRGWVAGSRKNARIGMQGKGHSNNDMNAISWLKNVRIATWDPDALAEEVRHVGEKFKKVDFEAVDIKHRKVVMSLQAPWNEHQNAVYLRLDIRFPPSYPRDAHANITVQKNSAVEEQLQSTLSSELHTIAEVYASQRRGCLEAILRYLLREQSLEQIVTWVMGESVADSKLIDPGIAPGDDSSDSDDDPLAGMGNAAASTANVRVPLAKGCGALWSETGKLVCFFPPKREEPDSIMGSLSMQNVDGLEASGLFEGFGRIHSNSPIRKATNGTVTAHDDSDTDSSDSLLASSSSSSTTSDPATALQGATLPYNKHIAPLKQRTHSADLSNQSTTMAGAKLAEAPRETYISIHNLDHLLPTSKKLAEKYKIAGNGPEICKHNAGVAKEAGREDLASIWTLASMILDKTVPLEVSNETINESESPVLVVARLASSRLHRKDSGISLNEGHEASIEKPNGISVHGQTRWGTSPLASTYLIPAMFDYYERIGDVQTLAMLTCVFAKSRLAGSGPATSTASMLTSHGLDVDSEQYYPSTSVAESMLQPDTEADGFVLVPQPRPVQTSRMLSSSDEQAMVFAPGSTFSLDPNAINRRTGGMSRTWSRAPSMSEDSYPPSSRSVAVSLSASPEGSRNMQRASTGGTLSTAQASLSALTQSFSHSPPGHNTATVVASSLKKYSPSGSLAPGWGIFSSTHGTRGSRASVHYAESSSGDKESSLRPSVSYSSARGLRRDGRLTPDASRRSIRSIANSEASELARRANTIPKKKTLKATLHNQSRFDIEGHAGLPLLDPALGLKYRAYRASYMHLLEAWRLHMQLGEIRKIDGIASEGEASRSPIKQARRKTLTANSAIDNHGLQVRRCCRNCGDMLAAIEKNGVAIGWHCINTTCATSVRRISKKTSCSVCHKTVAASSTPCLECGHLTCHECARTWFKPDTSEGDERRQRERRSSSKSTMLSTTSTISQAIVSDAESDVEFSDTLTCPTGCGCACPILNYINVPIPPPHADEILIHRLPMQRTMSEMSTTSQAATLVSQNDNPLTSFMKLTRTGSVSKATDTPPTTVKTGPVAQISPPKLDQELALAEVGNAAGGEEDRLLNPWADSSHATLRRGIGGGLSRGLREKGSDSTIRRIG